ncbi:MAG: hypothetical protein ACOCT9_02670 [archaeon]
MLQAQINGKCPELENKEDILTSTFFGYLELLEDSTWLIKILETFSQKNKQETAVFGDLNQVINELDENTELRFEFWPKMPDDTEPDLLIICDNGDSIVPLLFEIKYHSNLSGHKQLVKEYKNLIEKNWKNQSIIDKKCRCRNGLLIYLTKNYSIEEFEKSNEKIQEDNLNEPDFPRIYLKWDDDIFKTLKELDLGGYKKRILDDLENYLQYLDLVPFDGFQIECENIGKNYFYEFKPSSDKQPDEDMKGENMDELKEIGKNIRNAERVLFETYKNIDKMMDKLDEIANERNYMQIIKHFLRYRSDTKPKGYLTRNFLKLYQKNYISENSEDGFIDEPILGVQIDLTGGQKDKEQLPVVKIIKYIFDYEKSKLKNKTKDYIDQDEGRKLRKVFWGNDFETKNKGNYNILLPKNEDIISEYWHLEMVIFKEIPLLEIQNEYDIREKIFKELESMPEELD